MAKKKISKTLLIGLGGTGNLALKFAKKRFYEIYGNGTEYDKFDIPFIEYLALDTDVEDLKLGITPDSNLGSLNESDFHYMAVEDPKALLAATPFITREWFPKKNLKALRLASITAGAGQIRSLGRLGLMKNFKQIKSKIKSKIEQINSYETNPNFEECTSTLNVIFSFSVSGGTGSGTFLETAYLVKEILSTMNIKMRSQAYIILPEIFDKVIRKPIAKKRIWGNAYAALRELEFCMEGKNESDIVLNDNMKIKIDPMSPQPFDLVHLISDRNTEGKEYTKKDHLMELVANNIVLKSGELDTKSKSEYDNIKRDIDDIEPVRGQQPRYIGLGYSELTYDSKLVTEYYISKASSHLCSLMINSNRTMSEQELEKLANNWKIKEDKADMLIDQIIKMESDVLPFELDGDGYEGKDTRSRLESNAEEHLRAQTIDFEKIGEDFLKEKSNSSNSMQSGILGIIKEIEIDALNDGGINYAEDIINRLVAHPYLNTYKDQLKDEIDKYISKKTNEEGEISLLKIRITAALQELSEAQGSNIFMRKGNCIPIIDSIKSYYDSLNRLNAEVKRRKIGLDFYDLLLKELNKILKKLTKKRQPLEDQQSEFKKIKKDISDQAKKVDKPFSEGLHFKKIIEDQIVSEDICLENFLSVNGRTINLIQVLDDENSNFIRDFVSNNKFITDMKSINVTSYLNNAKADDVNRIFKDLRNAGQPLFSIKEDSMGFIDDASWVEGELWAVEDEEDPIYQNIKTIVSEPEFLSTKQNSFMMYNTIVYPAPIFTLNNIERYHNEYYKVSKKSYDIDRRLREKMDLENFEIIPRKNSSQKTQFAWIFGIILFNKTAGINGICRNGIGNYKVKSSKQGTRKNEFWVDLETPWRDHAFESFREKYLEAEILLEIKAIIKDKGGNFLKDLLFEIQDNDQKDYVTKYSQLNKDFNSLKKSTDPRDQDVLNVISSEQDFIKALSIETISEYLN